MPLSVLIQVVCVLVLVAAGTMMMVVGAFGSGLGCLLVSGTWFWRLYRDDNP
ncbi:hypothetical protein [Rhodococcus sp. WAY2]|uniref:hypothetical protein n=1 Tax=Rhodococcus sp. WAY2 TaxID=2663121 RepID=UPI00135CB64E|nr:hypothetical protein [Rhodococcus sp. WAY2]